MRVVRVPIAVLLATILPVAASAEPQDEEQCGGRTASAWAESLKSTGKKDAEGAARAFLALHRIGAAGEKAVPALSDILKSPGYPANVYGGAAEVLAAQSTEASLQALAAAFASPVPDARREAMRAASLRWMSEPMPQVLVGALAKLLADKDDKTARDAAETLEDAREEARTAVAALRKAVAREATSLAAAKALVAAGYPGCAGLPDIEGEAARLEKKSAEKGVRNASALKAAAKELRAQAEALKKLASADGRTFGEWKAALAGGKPEDRVAALKALGTLQADPEFRVEAAVRLLEDADQGVRLAAFRSLKAWGARARRLHEPAAAAVTRYVGSLTLKDSSGDGLFIMDLCGGLVTVAGGDAVPVLEKLALGGESHAVGAFRGLGPAAQPAAATLASIMVVKPPRRPAREWAAEALAGMGPLDAATTAKVAPALLEALQFFDYEDNSVRGHSLATLRRAAEVPAGLEELLGSLIARDAELLHEKLDRILALCDRFPAHCPEYRETFETVCFGRISWDIKGLQSAAFLAESAPETKGLAEWLLKELDREAADVSLKADDKDRSDPEDLLWILRGVRALGPAAAKGKPGVERALWSPDARVRRAAGEALKALK